MCLSDVRTETKRKALNSRTTDERRSSTIRMQPRVYVLGPARTAMRVVSDQIRIDKRTATDIDAAPRHGCRCGLRGGGPTSRAARAALRHFLRGRRVTFGAPALHSSLNGLHRLHQASHFCQLRLAALLPKRHGRREPGPACACPIFLPCELTSSAPACAC